MHGQEISDNEIYLLIKYIKSVLLKVAKRLSCIENDRCLTVKIVYCRSFPFANNKNHVRLSKPHVTQ